MIKNLQNNMFLVCRAMDLVPLIYGMINIKKIKKNRTYSEKKIHDTIQVVYLD